MSTSEYIAIAFLIIAIGDTFAAKYFFPSLFRKRTNEFDERQQKLMINLANASSLIFFVLALAVFFTKPFA